YAEHTGWWIFLGLVLTMTGVRAIVWGVYHHHKKPYRPTAIWAQLATLGSGLSGLLWGVGTASLVSDNLVEEMFLAFVIGGMCAGAVFLAFLPSPDLHRLCRSCRAASIGLLFSGWQASVFRDGRHAG